MSSNSDHQRQVDHQWDHFAADWRAGDGAPEKPLTTDFRRKVQRQSWLLMVTVVVEMVVSFGMIGFFVWEAYKEPTVASIALVLAVGLVIVVVWVFSMANRRGTWRPAVESTRAFVEISYLRLERKLQVLRLLPYLVVFELILIMPPALWRVYTNSEKWLRFQQTYLWRLAAVAVLLFCTWLFMLWQRRRISRQMEELDALRREVGEDLNPQ